MSVSLGFREVKLILIVPIATLITSGLFAAEPMQPGDQFSDCGRCPVMVVLPSGSFQMGSPENEEGRLDHEAPLHTVTIEEPFAIGMYEITHDQWNACYEAGGCQDWVTDFGWGRGHRPVTGLDYNQINAYLHWLALHTGHIYRLPTEAEWEYAARAGSRTIFHWGNTPDHDRANFGADACCTGEAIGRDRWSDETAPVGSFPPNAFGLFDMHGNASERVRDCWNPTYDGAPTDGSAWLTGEH